MLSRSFINIWTIKYDVINFGINKLILNQLNSKLTSKLFLVIQVCLIIFFSGNYYYFFISGNYYFLFQVIIIIFLFQVIIIIFLFQVIIIIFFISGNYYYFLFQVISNRIQFLSALQVTSATPSSAAWRTLFSVGGRGAQSSSRRLTRAGGWGSAPTEGHPPSP